MIHGPIYIRLSPLLKKTDRCIKMDTLPKTRTWLKNADSISDILCRSFLSTAVSCSHCVRPHLKCGCLRSYRPSETDVRPRKASEHQKEPHRDPAHIFTTQSAPAGTYRDVTAAVFRNMCQHGLMYYCHCRFYICMVSDITSSRKYFFTMSPQGYSQTLPVYN